jgi:hypothetical protein
MCYACVRICEISRQYLGTVATTYMVNMLTTDRGRYTLALGSTLYSSLILELSLLLNKVPLCGVVVTVVKLTVLNRAELSRVCLGKHLTILNGLNSAMVVILVNLLVDGSVDLLMDVRLDCLVGNSRSYSLVNGGVMVTGLVSEVGKSCLDFVHFEMCRFCKAESC